MTLDDALDRSLGRTSVLFVGAGFSRTATNLRQLRMKTSAQLAEHLSSVLGMAEDGFDLPEAAEEFRRRLGDDALIEELRAEFTTTAVRDEHLALVRFPWRRIYTTNYDDVIEESCRRAGRQVTPVTTIDEPRQHRLTTLLSVHLNGFVHRLTRDSLGTELRLTEESYLTASLAPSPWAALLRQDVELAHSVLFVGYGVGDLDIGRILLESESLRHKCVFVVGASPDRKTVRRTQRFGTVVESDLSALGPSLQAGTAKLEATPPSPRAFVSLRAFSPPQPATATPDEAVIDLLMKGDVKQSMLAAGFGGGAPYCLKRAASVEAIQSVLSGKKAVFLVGDFGNGKTLALEAAKFEAAQCGYAVFSPIERTAELLEEADHALRDNPRSLFVIDDYNKWTDLLKFVVEHGSDKSALLLSSRTATHDVVVDDLLGKLSVAASDAAEFNLDKLQSSELDWFAELLDRFGLWGERSGSTHSEKIRYLRGACHSEIHAILLSVLGSPQITNRLKSIEAPLRSRPAEYELLITALVLGGC